MELMSNILDLGYSLFWVDTDVVFFGNPLPYLDALPVSSASSCCVPFLFYSCCGLPAWWHITTGLQACLEAEQNRGNANGMIAPWSILRTSYMLIGPGLTPHWQLSMHCLPVILLRPWLLGFLPLGLVHQLPYQSFNQSISHFQPTG